MPVVRMNTRIHHLRFTAISGWHTNYTDTKAKEWFLYNPHIAEAPDKAGAFMSETMRVDDPTWVTASVW